MKSGLRHTVLPEGPLGVPRLKKPLKGISLGSFHKIRLDLPLRALLSVQCDVLLPSN